MIGGIYSDQRCPVCKGIYTEINKKGLFCAIHSEQQATRFKVRFKKTLRRFSDYESAYRFLNRLRDLQDHDSYDPQDYAKGNPLSFDALTEKWLATKKASLRPRSYSAIANHILIASEFMGARSIKTIDFATLEDFKLTLTHLSGKSISNLIATLREFFEWVKKRRYIKNYEVPEMPETPYTLGYRNITGKAEQQRILEEVRRLTPDNPKIWLGIKILCTYHAIRPGELLDINDGDWLFPVGTLRLTRTKTKTYRPVPMLEEDMEIARSFMDPKVDTRLLPFFRHPKGISGAKAGHKFSKNILYNWWKAACKNLGIEDLDLYGGTKHTTATALREYFSPEEIKKAGFIETNKAFERYFQVQGDDFRKIYRQASADPLLTHIYDINEKRKSLKSKQ